jgi:hypothetical protein
MSKPALAVLEMDRAQTVAVQPSQRAIERHWRIRAWLEAAGCRGKELASKWTVERHLDLMRQMFRQP